MKATEDKAEGSRLREVGRALRHRNFRIYFLSMLVSFTGTWMQRVAQSWLVYRLTGSAWWLGMIGFAGQIPVFVLALVGGVLADRYHRYRLILLTQTLAMIQALVLAVLTLTNQVTVGALLVLALLLGLINALDMPTRQSFVVELVGREDLMNAIALNSSVVNSARIVGPALAGVLVAWLGEGLCFLLNGLSYVAVIVGLLRMQLHHNPAERPVGSPLTHLQEGFAYVRGTRPVRALLLLLALVSLCGFPYMVLMPIFADRILGGGPRTLGILMGAAGVGALGGALALAARRQVQGLGRIVALSVATTGVMLMLFSFSRTLLLSTVLVALIGCTLMLQMAASNTLLQTMVVDRLRGRVMSFYSLSLIGMAPFGSLGAGVVATHIGAPDTVAVGGALCLLGALLFGVRLPSLQREAAPLLFAQGAAVSEPSGGAATDK
ncbi:MAG TPA: MFS transporter [Candidatus Binatia bacterium]|jgi:MFS family permease|nr:MFS transporter [Candidatus Binatia bacterium]